MDLKEFTKEDLKTELERRETIESKPVVPFNITQGKTVRDYSKVEKACEVHIQELADGRLDEDSEHYIYEAAMEAVYGKKIWDWVNYVAR